MQIDELKFGGAQEKDDGFLINIARNKWDSEQYALVEEIAAGADSTQDFIDRYLADPRTHMTQLYAWLLKKERPQKLWYAIREMFGEKQFKTSSDAGGVLIGNMTYSTLISNGYGDGDTRVAIFRDGESFNSDLMEYFTKISGKFGIYAYDCADPKTEQPLYILDGIFQVYFHEGFVAFVELNN